MSFPATAPNASKLPYVIRTTGWSLGGVIVLCGVGLAAGLLLFVAFLGRGHAVSISGLLIQAGALALAGICALRLWRLKDPEVELYPDRLVRPGLISPVVLYRSDIEGVSRIHTSRSGSYFNVVALPGRGQSVTFNGRLRSDPVFAEWLSGAPDPTLVAKAADRAKVLADDRYGSTEAERARRLQWATGIVIGFSLVCAGLALWLGFMEPPAPLSLVVALACLSIAYALAGASSGLIVMWRPQMGVRPPALAGFLPAAALAFRGLATGHLLTPEPLVIAAAVVGLAVGLLLFQQSPMAARRLQSAIALGVFGALLAYGAGAFADALSVGHPDHSYVVAVQGKHVSRGRSTTYYLDLDAWGDRPAAAVSVSSNLYYAVVEGSSVCIDHYRGDLRLPWFNIGLCKTAPAAAAGG